MYSHRVRRASSSRFSLAVLYGCMYMYLKLHAQTLIDRRCSCCICVYHRMRAGHDDTTIKTYSDGRVRRDRIYFIHGEQVVTVANQKMVESLCTVKKKKFTMIPAAKWLLLIYLKF